MRFSLETAWPWHVQSNYGLLEAVGLRQDGILSLNGSSSEREGIRKSQRFSRTNLSRSAVCRKRHMKCDELKPVCTPCAKGNRPCVYGPLPTEIEASTQNGHPRHDSTTSIATSASASSPAHQRSRPSISSVSDIAPPPPKRASFSTGTETRPASMQWPVTPVDDGLQILSPQSSYSNSTGYGTEVAPLRWFGLLAGDAAHASLDPSSLETLSDAALSQRYDIHPDGVSIQVNPHERNCALHSTSGQSDCTPRRALNIR